MRSVDVQPAAVGQRETAALAQDPGVAVGAAPGRGKGDDAGGVQALPASVASTTSPVHVVPASRSRLAGRVVGCQVASR